MLTQGRWESLAGDQCVEDVLERFGFEFGSPAAPAVRAPRRIRRSEWLLSGALVYQALDDNLRHGDDSLMQLLRIVALVSFAAGTQCEI